MRRAVLLAAASMFGAAHAHAFDCNRATTKVEKLICADRDLKLLDDEAASAYGTANGAVPAGTQAMLLETQKRWIAGRERCGDLDAPDQKSCVSESTKQREAFLNAIGSPGMAGALVPVFLVRPGKMGVYDRNVQLLKFANADTTGKRAFNAAVDRFLASVPDKSDEYSDTPSLTYEAQMLMDYSSNRFVSASISIDEYNGGAHGSQLTDFINIDLATGEAPAFADIFSAKAIDPLADKCREEIIKIKEGRNDPGSGPVELSDEETAAVKEGVSALNRWSFGDSTATVHFDPYAVGAYAEGSFKCEFDRGLLQPYIRSGAPIFQ